MAPPYQGLQRFQACEKGTYIGKPHRHHGTPSVLHRVEGRYDESDCPFCHGPLWHAPQCAGRSATDAEPYRLFWLEPMPDENIAVVCRECELAFFPKRDKGAQ